MDEEKEKGEEISFSASPLFRASVSKVRSDAFYPEPTGSGSLFRILSRKDISFRPGILSDVSAGLILIPAPGTMLEFFSAPGNVRRGIEMPCGIQAIDYGSPSEELYIMLREEKNRKAVIRRGEPLCLMRAVPSLGIYFTAPE